MKLRCECDACSSADRTALLNDLVELLGAAVVIVGAIYALATIT